MATVSQLERYIRDAAVKRGIDPDIAVKVAKSEGLGADWQSNVTNGGVREASFGPFQLYTGGGLGNVFEQQTGLDPRDESTVFQQVDFALDHAAQNGWSDFHGAANVGVSKWAGLNGAQPAGVSDGDIVQNTDDPFSPVANAGPAGWAYRDLVTPNAVKTEQVGGLLADKPKGMEALAPNGLLTDSAIAKASRAGLTPGISGVLDALGSDPGFANVSVTSTFRDPERNKAVGGAKRSQHMKGEAADFRTRTLPDEQKARFLDKAINAGAKGVGIYPSGNIHLDTRENAAIWGPQGYSSSPVSTFPEWSQPMLSDLTSGNIYTPYFDAPVPQQRPDLVPPGMEVAKAALPDVESAPQAPQQPQTTASFNQASTAQNLPSNLSFSPANVQRGLQLASLDQMPAGLLGNTMTDAPSPLASLMSPKQQMEPFNPPTAQRMLDIASTPPAAPQPTPPEVPTGGLLSPQLMGPAATLAQQQTALTAQKPALQTPMAMQQPTVAPTQESYPPAPDMATSFPAPPAQPQDTGGLLSPQTKTGMALGSLLGLPGMVAGGLLGRSMAGGLGGLLGDNGPMGPVGAADRFNAGSGIAGMERGMYGPRGSMGRSRSNPGTFNVSRGPGQGWDLSNQYGATTHYDKEGHIVATRDSNRRAGGLLGSLFGGGLLGGRSDRDRDNDSGRYGRGLF